MDTRGIQTSADLGFAGRCAVAAAPTVMVIVIVMLGLVVGGAQAWASGEVAYSSRSDTLMVGCDLYLLGRHVEPEARGGQVGYRVTRTADAVFINDIEYFNV
ncbi:MAG TPA: hypothetical protein VFX92_03735, partial [Candidatus Krumholzibacteria bacterium]|nr:hypothetical protein [Candidatus Krumholzibacteria bacterium]